MDFGIWAGFIGSVVLFLLTPSPVTVMVANNSAKQGMMAGLLTIAGTNTASLVLIGISFLVIYGVIAVSEHWLTLLTLMGCLYLLYFAVGLIKDSFTPVIETPQNISMRVLQKPLRAYFSQGFLVGISNPKDVLFFMAFFPLFFGISANKLLAMGLLTATWVVLDYAILLLYGLLFASVAKPKFIQLSSQLAGLVLVIVAVVGIVKSLTLVMV